MTIQTKYNVGDELYFIENNEIVKLKVSSINTSSYLQFESYVHVSLTYVFERPISSNSTNTEFLKRNEWQVYPSVKELVDAYTEKFSKTS